MKCEKEAHETGLTEVVAGETVEVARNRSEIVGLGGVGDGVELLEEDAALAQVLEHGRRRGGLVLMVAVRTSYRVRKEEKARACERPDPKSREAGLCGRWTHSRCSRARSG